MSDRVTVTLHHLVARLDAFAEEYLQRHHGVSFATFSFVAVAADLGEADITTLARALGVSKAAVSKRVPALVADGWVQTRPDPDHGRRVLVSPTGRALLLMRDAGGALEVEFTDLLADPRLIAGGVDADDLNRQLNLLLTVVSEKGPS
ncbi:MAG TPA: MarR family transcriptional regulator [Microbacterium sp.]|nr:MarR family transcriptional regulator [Microbacterium sp.]